MDGDIDATDCRKNEAAREAVASGRPGAMASRPVAALAGRRRLSESAGATGHRTRRANHRAGAAGSSFPTRPCAGPRAPERHSAQAARRASPGAGSRGGTGETRGSTTDGGSRRSGAACRYAASPHPASCRHPAAARCPTRRAASAGPHGSTGGTA